MPSFIAPDHPTQRLLFFIAEVPTDATRASVRSFVGNLARSRELVIHPPKVVDTKDHLECAEVDASVGTAGGYLDIYSALPPLHLPEDIDRQHLEEVCHLIEAVQAFSKAQALPFEFELDGDSIGSIEAGILDRSLRDGLLGEWKKHLGMAD